MALHYIFINGGGNWEEQAKRPFVQIKDHVLLPLATELEAVDIAFKTLLTPEKFMPLLH